MNQMIQTFKNAWKIADIRKKLLFTLFIVLIYRVGANLYVPFVNAKAISNASLTSGTSNLTQGIFGMINLFSGGAFEQASLFALNVSPYITASIVMQLLTIAFDKLRKIAEDGEAGRKKITFITRIITVALALVTSIGYVFYLNSNSWLVSELNFFRGMVIVACYCAGAALVMWLAEKINEKGIGNGISIILFANIIAGTFGLVQSLWETVFTKGGFNGFSLGGMFLALGEIICILGFFVLIVWMSDAERRIPIQYAKRVVGRKMYGGQNTNLPLKVNMSGVMPIIFANSIVAIPATIVSFMNKTDNWFYKFVTKFFNYNTWPYLVVFIILIFAFAYFYVAISFNPTEVANNIKNNGGAIPGIRVGQPTVDYIQKILNRITLVGAIFVAVIAGFPMLVNVIDVAIDSTSTTFAGLAFGGSSLMIVVGVALETVRELEAQMTLRNYKGFLD